MNSHKNLDFRTAQALERWRVAGLLTAEQCERIRQFEATHGEGQEHRLLRVLGILAALFIGFGLISLIAANWDLIPAALKLFVYFVVLGGLGLSLSRLGRMPGFLAEALPISYLVAILGGIGLIAQVYHLPNNGWSGLVMWSALGLAPTLVVGRDKTSLVWLLSYVSAWAAWITSGGSSPFGLGERADLIVRVDLFFLQWALVGLGAFGVGYVRLPTSLQPWVRPLSLGLVFLFYPYVLSFTFGAFGSSEPRPQWTAYGVVLLAWLWAPWFWPWLNRIQRMLVLAGLLAFSLRALLILAYGQHMDKHWANLAETLAVLVQGTAMAILALHYQEDRWFHLLGLLMAGRVVLLFVTLFGSLMLSGAGMILMGIALLLLLKAWHQHSPVIQARLREWGR